MTTPAPQITVLDGFTLNPGDLSWESLQALGECAIYDRTEPHQVVERAATATVVLTNKVVLTGELIAALPQLESIGVLATGYNVVDLEAASQRGILVTNVPAYSTASVAQMVFAHILNFTQRVSEHHRAVAAGRWAASADFCFWDVPLVELAGKTMGIVGLGQTGRAVAKLADALGMRVLAATRSARELPAYVTRRELDPLFQESDVISLHCPLTPATEKLVNRHRLGLMKKTALLINTSRGAVIDEVALAEALSAGALAGAGLDVLSVEPPPANHPLIGAPNCVLTPHIAWATREARVRLLETVVENIAAFLAGRPQNVVNEGC